jgi:HPt (histidine-containing phosphotransfer) domain-containing protein
MKDCIDRQDFKSYINEIYSLKSISANIGAKSLSKIVQTHESAYNSQDYDFIISNFSMLADTYQKVISEIKIILCSETIFNDKPETENYSENYSNTGIALIKAAEFIDNFEIQSAKSQLEKLFDSDETDWIKKQVIKRAIKMIDNCCYQDTRNLVIAMAEGEKF